MNLENPSGPCVWCVSWRPHSAALFIFWGFWRPLGEEREMTGLLGDRGDNLRTRRLWQSPPGPSRDDDGAISTSSFSATSHADGTPMWQMYTLHTAVVCRRQIPACSRSAYISCVCPACTQLDLYVRPPPAYLNVYLLSWVWRWQCQCQRETGLADAAGFRHTGLKCSSLDRVGAEASLTSLRPLAKVPSRPVMWSQTPHQAHVNAYSQVTSFKKRAELQSLNTVACIHP